MLSLLPDRPWVQPPKVKEMNPEKASTATSQKGAKAARKENKRNSDIRREQNRVASRTYRQKRKEKLALLQQLLDGPKPESAVTESTSTGATLAQEVQNHAAETNISTAIPPTEAAAGIIDPALNSDSQIPGFLQFQSQSFEDLLFDDAWPNSSLTSGQEAGLFGGRAFVIRDPVSSLVDDTLNSSGFQPSDHPASIPPVPSQPEAYSTSSYTAMPEAGQSFMEEQQIISLLNLSKESTLFNEAVAVENTEPIPTMSKGKGAERQTSDPFDSLPSPILKAVDCFSALRPTERQRVLSLLAQSRTDPETTQRRRQSRSNSATSDDSTHGLGTLGRLLDRVSGMAVPDVKRNTIHVMQNGFFTAILENALAIGLTQNHELLEEEALSPFGVGAQASPLMIAQTRLRFSSTPKDLQPLDHQILIQHHPYIDVIPFPTFRERALRALTCDPPLFDEEELCDDFRRDGMIVWGSQGNNMGMAACTAWDMRSWEPQLWFLKKYWFLVGGWDDELWRAARWWHTMRNERLDLSQSFAHV